MHGGRGGVALRLALREARLTPSPNAGWTMAVMAGALGRRLEKPGHYVLGAAYPQPGSQDIRAALVILRLSAVLAVAAFILGLMSSPALRGQHAR